MAKRNEQFETGWDARIDTLKEILWRQHLVLDADWKDPLDWYEKLKDYFKVSSGIIRKFESEVIFKKLYKELKDIDMLLTMTSKEVNGKKYYIKSGEKSKNYRTAYDRMDMLEMEITYILTTNNILIPVRTKQDPGKAMMDMNI